MNTVMANHTPPSPEDDAGVARRAHIAQVRHRLVNTYLASWDRMIQQWSADEAHDACWVMHSANYLFRTGKVRWAIDPLRLSVRLPEAPEPNLTGLGALDFILLTHLDSDHRDRVLWRSLREQPTRWVVPQYMVDLFLEATGLTQQQWGERLVIPTPLAPVELHGLRVTPFEGMHWAWDAGAPKAGPPTRGIPAMGYLVESQTKRWLFPGDTRTYDRSLLPDFGAVDVVFAHVWLGRASALLAKPPELENFSRFVAALSPREQIVLAHLYETSRPEKDCWVDVHATLAASVLRQHLPLIQVHAPAFWERHSL